MNKEKPDDHHRPRRLTRLLNISEVADVLDVDVRHVRRVVHERASPTSMGHLLRFDPAEIEAWSRAMGVIELTIEEAAQMLNVSRPHLIKDRGWRHPPSHGRDPPAASPHDVPTYRDKAAAQAAAAFDAMAAEAEEQGLYDEWVPQ